MNITMQSEVYVVDNILKPTTAALFKNVKVGNRLQFTVPIKYAGTSRGRSYSVNIKTFNLSTNETTLNTFNQLPIILEKFELRRL